MHVYVHAQTFIKRRLKFGKESSKKLKERIQIYKSLEIIYKTKDRRFQINSSFNRDCIHKRTSNMHYTEGGETRCQKPLKTFTRQIKDMTVSYSNHLLHCKALNKTLIVQAHIYFSRPYG